MDTPGTDKKNEDPGFLNSDTSADLPQEPPTGKPKSLAEILSKQKLDDTEIFDGDEMVMATSSESDEASLKYSYHEKIEDEFEETSPSIMDLIQTNAPPVDPLISTETDIEIGDDINSRIEGKSLDEILKTSIKDEKDWHKSKKEGISETTTDKGKHKRLKITMLIAIILIAIGAFVVNFVIKKPEVTDLDTSALPLSINKIKISPNLKDPKQLKRYYSQAKSLYRKERYNDAVKLFSQLLKTGWNKGLIYGMLGNCKLKLKDETAAEKYYRLSLKEGYREDIEFAINLAEILKKENNYSDIIAVLTPFIKGNESNQKLQLILAETYTQTGDTEKTIECYKRLNPGNLSEKQLQDFAMSLEASGDKKYAFKIYLLLGKLYNRTSAYIKAEQLAPDEDTRISILSKIVSKTASTPQGNYYKLILAIKMIDAGNTDEGVALLKSLKTENIAKDPASQYLMMAPYFDNEPILTRDLISILNKYYADDIKMHNKIMNLIQDAGKPEFCKDFFKQEYLLYPENPIAGYFYAINLKNPVQKKALLVKTIKLSPSFFYARLALAKMYINEQNWKDAYKLLEECLKQDQYNSEVQFYLTVAKINLSSTSRPLKEYELFLQQAKIPKQELIKKMVLMAEHMHHDKYALIYLNQAENEKELKEFSAREKIKIKLIYKSIKKEDFSNTDDPIIKKYYIIYLLSIGEERTVMNMPADNNPDIEFWKLFIRWKRGLPSWKQKSYKLLDSKKDDYLISSILKLWVKKISLKEAESRLSSIPIIDRPLFATIIAEQYKKDRQTVKSNFFYRKALRYPNPNIYVQFSNYMRTH